MDWPLNTPYACPRCGQILSCLDIHTCLESQVKVYQQRRQEDEWRRMAKIVADELKKQLMEV